MPNIIINKQDFKYFKKNNLYLTSNIFFLKNGKINSKFFIENTLSEKKLNKIYKYILNLQFYISKFLYKKLNFIHEEKYSSKYWNILIDPWLLYFIQNIYSKWLTIENLCNRRNNLNMNCYISKKSLEAPSNFNDYFNLMQNEQLNAFLLSDIAIKNFKKKIKINRKINFSLALKKKISKEKFNENTIKRLFNYCCINKSDIFLDNYPRFSEIFKLSLKKKIFPYFLDLNDDYNLKKKNLIKYNRSQLINGIKPRDKFEKYLFSILPIFFPKSYLENYKDIKKSIKTNLYTKVSRIYSCVNHIHNDKLKIWIASMLQNKAKLITIQHGGAIGSHCFNTSEYLDKKNAYKYITWGWKETPKDKPGPMILKKPIWKNGKKMLLILYAFPTYNTKILPNLNQDCNLEFFENQINFIKQLDKRIHGKLNIRLPRMSNVDYFYKRNIKKISNKITFDDNDNINLSISNANFVVTTLDSTVFLQSISSSCPTIGIWKKETTIHRKSSKKDYKNLLKKRLIFNDFNKAANFINNNYNNIDKWWNQVEKNKVLINFKKKYCNKEINFSNLNFD